VCPIQKREDHEGSDPGKRESRRPTDASFTQKPEKREEKENTFLKYKEEKPRIPKEKKKKTRDLTRKEREKKGGVGEKPPGPGFKRERRGKNSNGRRRHPHGRRKKKERVAPGLIGGGIDPDLKEKKGETAGYPVRGKAQRENITTIPASALFEGKKEKDERV